MAAFCSLPKPALMTTACAFQTREEGLRAPCVRFLDADPGSSRILPRRSTLRICRRELQFLRDLLHQINISQAGGKSRVTHTCRGIKDLHTCSRYQKGNTPPPPLRNPPSRRPSQEARPSPAPPRSSLAFFSFHCACPASALQMTQFLFLGGSIGGDVPKPRRARQVRGRAAPAAARAESPAGLRSPQTLHP